jgi:hypothetical protein
LTSALVRTAFSLPPVLTCHNYVENGNRYNPILTFAPFLQEQNIGEENKDEVPVKAEKKKWELEAYINSFFP